MLLKERLVYSWPFQYSNYFLETLVSKENSFFLNKLHLICMRNAAENIDCHVIKDRPNVF